MGRILALDPGSRRVGVAVTDAEGIAAHPRPALDARSTSLLDEVGNLVRELGVEEIVVGLPISLNGTEGAAAVAARSFAAAVKEHTGVPTVLVDERFSTVIAERALVESDMSRRRRREARDGAAAAVLLQGYLDGRR